LLERSIPVGVDASVAIGENKILFDVTVEFAEPVKGEACIWLNPGLTLSRIIVQSNYKASLTASKDPDIGFMDAIRVSLEVDQPVKDIRVIYKGLLKPVLIPGWGSHGNIHIARSAILWYPFTISCQSILWGLLLCEHSASTTRFKLEEGLRVASSIEYQGVESGEHVYTSKFKAGCLEFVAGPFKIDSYSGEKAVNVYTLSEPVISARQAHDAIVEVEGAFEELFGVKPPHGEYNVVVHEKTGGFKAGSLIILDKDQVKTMDRFKAIVAHELSHTWWGGLIKLCSPDSQWLWEAVPEYTTTIILDKLGILSKERFVEKLLKRAQETLKQEGYKPPMSIWIPLSDIEDASWRIVGEAILHEIASEVGYSRFNEIIGSHMKKSIPTRRRYCLKWNELLNELKATSEKVEDILKRYVT